MLCPIRQQRRGCLHPAARAHAKDLFAKTPPLDSTSLLDHSMSASLMSPPSPRPQPPGAPVRGAPRPAPDDTTESRALQSLAGPNSGTILCQQVSEADGGCFGCTLPAYHSGQHSIYSKGRTRHSNSEPPLLSVAGGGPAASSLDQLASTLCAEASKAVERAAASTEKASAAAAAAKAEAEECVSRLQDQSESNSAALGVFKEHVACSSSISQAAEAARAFLRDEEERHRSEQENASLLQQKRQRADAVGARLAKCSRVEQTRRALKAKAEECLVLANQVREEQHAAASPALQ